MSNYNTVPVSLGISLMPRTSRISPELLDTFITVLESDGDASRAAEKLNINQPSMSKRLALLQRPGPLLSQPWLVRQGKSWKATAEGERVRAAARDMIHRYDQFQSLLINGAGDVPDLSLACGREAVKDVVLLAVKRFRKQYPHWRIRISTPTGKERMEGVATGVYDMAIITQEPQAGLSPEEQTMEQLDPSSRRPLFHEALFEDRFVLAAGMKPGKDEGKTNWHRRFLQLPEDQPVPATVLTGLPLIVPEPGRGRRVQLEHWARAAGMSPLDVVLEMGGWEAILHYAAAGLGIAFATERATENFMKEHGRLQVRRLDEAKFPPDAVRLIAWKAHGVQGPELNPPAAAFRAILLEVARSETKG